MFQIGEIIVHPNSGVCEISDIRFERFSGSSEKYYVLSPAFSTASTKIYVPVSGNKVILRYPLSTEQVLSALSNATQSEFQWIDDEKQRMESFDSILKEKNPTQIIEMICALHKNKKERLLLGKKFRNNDEKILSEAEKIINQEFAFVLGISPDDIPEYIMKKLNIQE